MNSSSLLLPQKGVKTLDFKEHREQTAKDCEEVAQMLTDLAAEVREGNLDAFERFFWEGGTEEGDAKISAIREMLIIRYMHRQELCREVGDSEASGESMDEPPPEPNDA